MVKVTESMFTLLRFALTGKEPEADFGLTEKEWNTLLYMSKNHDLAHLIAVAVEKGRFDVPDAIKAELRKQKMTAVYRSGMMEAEYDKIAAAFEKEGIEYIPLKGSVIKKLYPESWMRTSCDIDILVREEELSRAEALLREKLCYKNEDKPYYHDMPMVSENGVHLELHFSLKEKIENIDDILSEVWENTEKKSGYEVAMTNEFFLFHVLAHMVYHFRGGGCGIRQVMDLHILKKKLNFDEDVLRSYLKRCGIENFYNEMIKLSEVWFEGKEHTELSKRTEIYIINGGVYGNIGNNIVIKQINEGGKKGYYLERIFMRRKSLELLYPNLKKYPYLYLFYTVKRWMKLIKKDVRKRIKREIDITNKNKKESVFELKNLLEDLGI